MVKINIKEKKEGTSNRPKIGIGTWLLIDNTPCVIAQVDANFIKAIGIMSDFANRYEDGPDGRGINWTEYEGSSEDNLSPECLRDLFDNADEYSSVYIVYPAIDIDMKESIEIKRF